MSYEVSTTFFEGPLDLLLHLIEKKELDVTQLALAQVTDEFLTHVETMRENMELAVVAEFLAVAARLLWIKSRALLPKPPKSTAARDDEEDEGDALVQQLRAYRQYKEAAQWLREHDYAGLRSYVYVTPPPRPQRVTLDLSGITLEKLYAAAQNAIFPSEKPRPQEALQRPRISIVDQIRLIRRRFAHWATVSYRKLLSKEPSRVEAVVTLQAILELIKQRAVVAEQEHPFGDIIVIPQIPPEEIAEPAVQSEEPPSPPPDR